RATSSASRTRNRGPPSASVRPAASTSSEPSTRNSTRPPAPIRTPWRYRGLPPYQRQYAPRRGPATPKRQRRLPGRPDAAQGLDGRVPAGDPAFLIDMDDRGDGYRR